MRFRRKLRCGQGWQLGLSRGGWQWDRQESRAPAIDEIDALTGDVLVAVLRQLRDSHLLRPKAFAHSVCIFGMRDVRDYKVASGGPDSLGTSSPFNIKRESLTVRNFDRTAIAALFGQHTAQIGQVFSPAATDRVLELTASQPHLVNSLADEVVRNQPWQLTVEVPHVDAAKEALILRWGTHFDSLMAPLREDRLRRVVEPRVASASPRPVAFEDERYCRDLGPIDGSPPMIANAIYRELIPGFLTRDHQLGMARLRWSKWAST